MMGKMFDKMSNNSVKPLGRYIKKKNIINV